MNRDFKLHDGLFGFACLAGAFLCLWFFQIDLNRTLSRMNEEPLGTITWKYKAAQRRFIDRVLWDRLQRDSPVYSGDLIRTADLSQATVSYFRGGIIDLEENSIVQIFEENNIPRIELSEGSIRVSAKGGGLIFSAGGNVVALKDGDAAEIRPGANSPDIQTKQIIPPSVDHIPAPVLITPAEGHSYNGELPQLRFRWTSFDFANSQSEEAAFYLLEVADNEDMNNPQFRIQTRTPSVLSSQLGKGRWYWRVTPAYGSSQEWGNPSPISFFVIEQNPALTETPAAAINIAARPAQREISVVTRGAALRTIFPPDNYTAAESLLADLRFTWRGGARGNRFQVSADAEFSHMVIDTQVSGEMTQAGRLEAGTWYWRVIAGDLLSPARRLVVVPALPPPVLLDSGESGIIVVPVVAAAPVRVQTPAPPQRDPNYLGPVSGLSPVDNFVYDAETLRGVSSIIFSWGAAEGAAGYTFTLFREDGSQVLREKVSQNSFVLPDRSVLSRGNFIWQIEAERPGENGSTIGGNPIRQRFTVDIPEVRRNQQLQDIGTYGN
jgi:hypothetical protein